MQEIPESVAVEARAEIVWGKSPRRVLELLQSKGVGDKSALLLIERLLSERAAMIRSDGIRKLVWGTLFAVAPLCYYLFSMWLGHCSHKLFAGLIVLGAYGLGKLANGISMIARLALSPATLRTQNEQPAQQGARANDHVCHASCFLMLSRMKVRNLFRNVSRGAPAAIVAHL